MDTQFNIIDAIVGQPTCINHLSGDQKLNPNGASQIQMLRSGHQIAKYYVLTLTAHMKPLCKQSEGTGGGLGAPENFYDWKKRDDASRTYLAWICMKDKETLFLITTKN